MSHFILTPRWLARKKLFYCLSGMFAAILKSFRFDSIAFLFFASKNYVFWEATVVTKEIKIVFNFPVCCKFLESFQVCNCFSLLIKKDWWNLKENSLHQGSNQGPLACLAEMLTITPSDLVERLRSHQHLYYIFEYCILFFQKPQRVW